MEWLIFGILLLIFGAGAWWLYRKSRALDAQDAILAGAGTNGHTAPLPHRTATHTSLIAPTRGEAAPVLARSVEAAVTLPPTSPYLHLLTPSQRKHTCMAGATGDGKTATMNTLLVADIASGAHCIVCSTHFTAYHPEDQPIDLRPIQHLFEVAYTIPAITTVIAGAIKEKDKRMELYRAGQPVGGDMVIYLGEWGAIKRALGKAAEDTIQALLDEGRKTRIWIVIEYHSMLVSRTGGDSALREQYRTRLAGNVDKTTWETAVGKAIPQVSVALGTWMTDRGLVKVARPTDEYIAYLAPRHPVFNSPLAPDVSAVSGNDLWLSGELEPADEGDEAPVLTTGTRANDDDLTLSTASTTPSTGYPVPVQYQQNGQARTVEMSEVQAAAIEKWLTADRLSGNEIVPKLGIARGAGLAMVAHVKGQLAVREVMV